MRRIKRVNKADGSLYGWHFWCHGCEDIHTVGASWRRTGDEERPTFSPSVLVNYRKGYIHDETRTPQVCHSFITAGRIQFLGDCTHALAGQTVDLPDESQWPEWMR